jgi:hypothetical protein
VSGGDWLVGYPSGQRGQTVNLLAYAFIGSNPIPTTIFDFADRDGNQLCRDFVVFQTSSHPCEDCELIKEVTEIAAHFNVCDAALPRLLTP